MTNLVGEHIGLRKFSRRSETPLEFVVETQIDIDFFVAGAVKRSARGLRHAASGIDAVAEQHQLGMPVGHSLCTQDLSPGFLRVIEHERYKLNQWLFFLVLGGVRLADLGGSACTAAHSGQRQEISFKYEAQYQKNDKAANSDMAATDVKTPSSASSATAVISAIFDVIAGSTRCPPHKC